MGDSVEIYKPIMPIVAVVEMPAKGCVSADKVSVDVPLEQPLAKTVVKDFKRMPKIAAPVTMCVPKVSSVRLEVVYVRPVHVYAMAAALPAARAASTVIAAVDAPVSQVDVYVARDKPTVVGLV